ncbi:MAG: hypothetical protein LBU34_07360 [Planctomycetaceae bacterium]|nr:hypothetical protein [Planctomycetaceae bacterium]
MFSFILFIFCFLLVPITIGFLVSVVLRELYKRQLWEKSILGKEDDKFQETLPESAIKLYDPSLDEISSEKTLNTETDTEPVRNEEPVAAESIAVEPVVNEPIVTEPDSELNTESVFPAAISETSETISELEQQPFSETPQPETIIEPEIFENKLPSVFDDQNMLPDSFKINDVFDEMVGETPLVIPADLSSRIEEHDSPKNPMNPMENEEEQDLLKPDENEIFTKTIAPTKPDNQPHSQPEITHNNFNNEENSEAVNSEISPMAVEILGDDFNFDSFFEEKLKPKQKNKEPITVHEIGQGIYQADGGFVTNDSTLLNLLPKEQTIVSSYPDNLIQNAVVEPDLSETAQDYSFTEELAPMFIRKRNKK